MSVYVDMQREDVVNHLSGSSQTLFLSVEYHNDSFGKTKRS
jgi:hypothetical protein